MSNPTWSPESWTTDGFENFEPSDINFSDYLIMPSDETNSPSVYDPHPSSEAALPAQSAAGGPITCTGAACGCGCTFKRRSDLKKHVERFTRPHQCAKPGCARSFTNKHDLDRHGREVHNGAGAVKIRCPVPTCNRHHHPFNRKDNLAQHMRNRHKSTEAAEFALAEIASRDSGSVSGASPAAPPTPALQDLSQELLPQELGFDAELGCLPPQDGGSGEFLLSLQLQLDALVGCQKVLQDQINAVQSTISFMQPSEL